MIRVRIAILSLLLILTPLQTSASELRTFLMSCAYGTGIGALGGLTAMALSDSPGSNVNMIAKGASLGLYAGIAVGAYMISEKPSSSSSSVESQNALPGPWLAVVPGSDSKPEMVVGYRLIWPD